MKIAIHFSEGAFSERWLIYCEANKIDYKLVDCYNNNIIQELSDCDALMWHFHQNSPKAVLFAKQLLFSVQSSGMKVFPDFNTAWHFDDKVGQKYLLESIGAPFVPTWVYYDKKEALEWSQESNFPKVFKLRGGAGSQNVILIKSRLEAGRLIRRAFSKGFLLYDPIRSIIELWRRYRLRKVSLGDLIHGMARFIVLPPYARIKGREMGYIYFQEYIPGNDHDIRIVVIGDKAFAIKRMVRNNDFRASGSGVILYNKDLFDMGIIRLSFSVADQLKTQCVAIDYVHDNGNPLIVEISYGFSPTGYDLCPGYWDKDLTWHEGKFNPYGWMVENIIKQIINDQKI